MQAVTIEMIRTCTGSFDFRPLVSMHLQHSTNTLRLAYNDKNSDSDDDDDDGDSDDDDSDDDGEDDDDDKMLVMMIAIMKDHENIDHDYGDDDDIYVCPTHLCLSCGHCYQQSELPSKFE